MRCCKPIASRGRGTLSPVTLASGHGSSTTRWRLRWVTTGGYLEPHRSGPATTRRHRMFRRCRGTGVPLSPAYPASDRRIPVHRALLASRVSGRRTAPPWPVGLPFRLLLLVRPLVRLPVWRWGGNPIARMHPDRYRRIGAHRATRHQFPDSVQCPREVINSLLDYACST